MNVIAKWRVKLRLRLQRFNTTTRLGTPHAIRQERQGCKQLPGPTNGVDEKRHKTRLKSLWRRVLVGFVQ